MFLALVNASGSPGTSTTALGLALNAPSDRVLYVEADPVGTSFVHAGYLKSLVEHKNSLVKLVEPNRHGRLAQEFATQVMQLPATNVWVLPALKNATQADSMKATWGPLGAHLSALDSQGATVVADAGRLGHRSGPDDLIRQADLIGVVVRPALTSLAPLQGTLPLLRKTLAATKSRAALGLVLIGNDPYTPRDVSRALNLDVITTIPDSPRHAKIFSEGAALTSFQRTRSTYLRSLRHAWPQLITYTDQHRPEWARTTIAALPTPPPPTAVAVGATP